MRAVFVYDHDYLETKDGEIYSSGAFNQSSWERYLEHFEELTVVGQNKSLDNNLARFNPVKHPKVSFEFFKPIKTIKAFASSLFKKKKSLEVLIRAHDGVIVRMYSEWAFQAIRIAKKLGKPYAIELVGCPWDAYTAHHSHKAKVMAPFSYLRLRNAIRQSSYVLYVTEKFLQNRYPTKGHQIGVSNVMLIEPSSYVIDKRLQRIDDLIINQRPIQIGVIGKVDVKAKGMDVLITALSKLKVNFKLNIVGPGDQLFLKGLVEKYKLADSVIFHGKLMAGENINKFLDDLDIYIHPSKQEGLPRSVIEAMARACPILASSIAGTPELIDKRFLHTPGNSKQLASQIQSLVMDISKWNQMAIDNFERAKDYYPEKLIEKRGRFWSKFSKECVNNVSN